MSVDANKLTTSSMRTASFAGSVLLNKRTANCLNKRIQFQKGSIVITLKNGLDYGKIGSKHQKPASIVATIDLRKLQLRNLA
jgi:hypothetical protein